MKKPNTNGSQDRVLNEKLLAYTAGAGAALVAAQGAQAAIQYSGALEQAFGSDSGDYSLTMEGDNVDFTLAGRTYAPYKYSFFEISAEGNNGLIGSFSDLVQLNTTQSVKSDVAASSNIVNSEFYLYYYPYYLSYPLKMGWWDTDNERAYFGFALEREDNDQRVYGWAEVERIDKANGKLLGWAYEDSGDPIQVGAVPEPGALGLLALGAAGVAAIRRYRKALID